MKRLLTLLAFILVLSISVTACAVPVECAHNDGDGGGICDSCKEKYAVTTSCQHRDENDDNLCDKCGEAYTDGKDIPEEPLCQHRDENDDNLCDKCCEPYTDGKDVPDAPVCQHRDENDDNLCDKCGAEFADGKECEHRDENDDNLCDKCGEAYSDGAECAHHDWNDDLMCDLCYVHYDDGRETSEESTLGLTYKISRGSAVLTGSIGSMKGDVVISDTYMGYPVEFIDVEAFKGQSNITSVKIPDSVKSIQRSAFEGCGLEKLYLGRGIVMIAGGAFTNCFMLKDIYISDLEAWCNISFMEASSNPLFDQDAHENDKRNLYLNNVLVTTLIIPDSVSEILPYSFAGCSSIENVVIHDNVTGIKRSAFYWSMRIESVIIGGRVTSIEERAFCECRSLTKIEFRGSSEQWDAIEKGIGWIADTPSELEISFLKSEE